MAMIVRATDVENTGEREGAAVIEIGVCDVVDGVVEDPIAFLVNPHRPIMPAASGVHHLVNADVADADDLENVGPDALLPLADYYAAHNADTEKEALGKFVPDAIWLCTWKCAMRAWPEAPDFRLQTLRYWLGISQDPKGWPAHRGGPDAYVTARVVALLLSKEHIGQLAIWSQEDPHWPRVPFGAHYDKPWADLEDSYLDWMGRSEIRDDYKRAGKREQARRKAVKAEEYVLLAIKEAGERPTIENLTDWFRMQANRREMHGIVEGTLSWQRIVDACAARKAQLPPQEPPPAEEPVPSPAEETT